jgi:uncharacterized membrane protein YeaQ/YmgE (transglycosylase-associated protein family)
VGGLIYWLIIGLIAGFLTGKVMGTAGKDVLTTIITGIIGALVGGFVMSLLGGAYAGGFIRNVIVATLGAILVTWAYRKFAARRQPWASARDWWWLEAAEPPPGAHHLGGRQRSLHGVGKRHPQRLGDATPVVLIGARKMTELPELDMFGRLAQAARDTIGHAAALFG